MNYGGDEAFVYEYESELMDSATHASFLSFQALGGTYRKSVEEWCQLALLGSMIMHSFYGIGLDNAVDEQYN